MFVNQLFRSTLNEAVEEEVFFTINDPELYDIIADKFFGEISWHGTTMAVSRATWSRVQATANKMGFDADTDLEEITESLDEVTVIHDNPEHKDNPSVVPDGGMGTWSVETLRSSLTRQLEELAKMVKYNAKNVDFLLYKAGAIQAKVEALAKVEKYLDKLGKRRVAKGKQVELD